MQLSVQDLGEERFVTLLGRSMTALQTANSGRYSGHHTSGIGTGSGKVAKTPKRLVRFWTKSLNLNEEQSQRLADQLWNGAYGNAIRVFFVIMVMHMMMPVMLGLSGSFPATLFGFVFPIIWALIMTSMLVSPRHQFKNLVGKNLTAEEVEWLLPTARGRLERQYLSLVLDTLRTEIPTESAQKDIRAALQHLGNAISRLPADPVSVVDADSLRKEARTLREQAARESDSFIEGSLLRQAEMLEQRATLTAQTGRAARRMAALRREARTQMDNLRGVLVGFQQTSPVDTMNVTQLSAALQRAAGEAKAVALARHELENEDLERMFGSSLPPLEAQAVPIPASPVQVIRPATTAPQTPSGNQPPSSQKGPWWRNNGTPG